MTEFKSGGFSMLKTYAGHNLNFAKVLASTESENDKQSESLYQVHSMSSSYPPKNGLENKTQDFCKVQLPSFTAAVST